MLGCVDACFVLASKETREVWKAVLELLADAVASQHSRSVLPSIDHATVHYFLKEWQGDGEFAPAAAEHPAFAYGVWRFARAWRAAGAT